MSAGHDDASAATLRAAFPRVIGALICVHAAMASTRVAASLLLLHQGRPAWMVGAMLSLFAVAPLGLALWAGRLADRHGMHRPLGVGVVMGFVGASVAVVSEHPLALAVAALATGGALSVAAVGVQREAGLMARSPADLKRVFSWVALGPAVSNALAPILVGLLIDHVSFQAGFMLAAVLPGLAWWLGRTLPRAPAPVDTGSAPAPRAAWALLKLPALRILLLINVALAATWDAHSLVVPLVGHARGLSASAIGVVLGSFAVAATVVRLAISRWGEQVRERQALKVAMWVAVAVCVVYAWLPGVVGMMAGSAVLGLALGSVQPMVLAGLHQVTPADRHGQALGLRMLISNASTIVMPLVLGLLAGATVAAAPLWAMALVVALTLVPAARLRLPRPGD